MKILFLCRFLPHPTVRTSGGQDIFHYIASLSERHQVTVIAFVTPEQADSVTALAAVSHQVVPVPYQPDSLISRLWRLAWRLLLPPVYGRVFSLTYRARLGQLLAQEKFDIALIEGPMARYANKIQNAKRVLDEIDIYSAVAFQEFQNAQGILGRAWTRFNWLRQQAAELECLGTYDAALVRSAKDRTALKAFLPDLQVAVVHPWFEGLDELQTVTPIRPQGNRLLFVGAMNHPANIEAVIHFSHQVFPLIRREVPDAELAIVGNKPTLQVLALDNLAGIMVTGEVERLLPYYERCAVNIVPLMTGGGIIVKTLNGLAAARPTVSTSIGNSGTGAQSELHLLIADHGPQDFANQVIKLLTDPELWTRLASSGRGYIQANFNWNNTIQDLETFLFAQIAQNSVIIPPKEY